MMHNLYNYESEFKIFLQKEGVASATRRNYSADVRYFCFWLSSVTPAASNDSLGDEKSVVTPEMLNGYEVALTNNHISPATHKRRRAGLKRFILFLTDKKVLSTNELEVLMTAFNKSESASKPNPSETEVITQFKTSLEIEGLSPASIRNYAADVGQFLTWLNTYEHV